MFDNPELIVACVIGDGEAETGPLATAWQSNKFLDPITDVNPADLHLNGYKISNPTVLARIGQDELEQFLGGCGWTPHFVEGDDPETMHELMAATLDTASEDIRPSRIARPGASRRPAAVADDRAEIAERLDRPQVVDGLAIEGTFKSAPGASDSRRRPS